jgi:hypothetical protein
MQGETYKMSQKIIVVVAYIIMIAVNSMANILPINDMSTGMISDSYPNLFAPAGLTFSIWGVIYFLLAGYTLYQLGLFQKTGEKSDPALMKKISFYFIISSLANAAWIFAWHYLQFTLSVGFMAVILISLILINREINNHQLSGKEKFFLKLPFSVYFGWITVATIANITVLLVSIGWDGFGISESAWASIIIVVGMLIGGARMLKDRNIAYGLVLIWAYLGILIKHVGSSGFNGQYPLVIAVVGVCMVIFITAEGYIIASRRQKAA